MLRIVAAAALLATTAAAQTPPLAAAQPDPAKSSDPVKSSDPAKLSDPVKAGLMQGSPVPADKQVRWDNGSMWAFPNTRWAFSNQQALVPTATIHRAGVPSALPRAEKPLDTVAFTTFEGKPMTWGQAFDTNYTDGIIVLHKGRVVYERYAGALRPEGRHIAMSVTKSFVGTLAELLIHEGKLDDSRTVASYVPELAQSGFGSATLRQLLDMRTAIAFNEDYAGGGLSDVNRMAFAVGMAPNPPGFSGPDGNFAFAASLGANGRHGGNFVYRTPNTMALQWVVERVGGAPLAMQISSRFWQPMGMEQDATLNIDRIGTAFGGGGMNVALRDMARFGEMIRLGGRWNGRQILPAAVAKAILTPGDAAAFAATKYPGLDGGSYRSQWWHRAGGQTMAVGVHGQGIYIDPKHDLVIARFASHPVASNRAINATTLPAYDAVAQHLTTSR
ncbi:serine hydrolase domain-containing protein [Sandaracinobacteroides hominis]|uniref:serine hydrolase domain-containing protein n=1 Tax=Sandaracinobacteroides hominis TaxID=2780086 RepID=UPI0018F676AA|nr:serine hydrolase [Sandaracinobacteroides hominis]